MISKWIARFAQGGVVAGLLLALAPAHAQYIGGDLNLDLDQDRSAQFLAGDVTLRGRVGGDISGLAGNVDITADIGGSVQLAAGDIVIRGTVGRDVSLAGANISILADVSGSADLAGADIRIGGRVGRDLAAGGALIAIDESGSIGGNMDLAGSEIRMSGTAQGRLKGRARTVIIEGTVAGDVELHAENVEIMPGAQIAGQLRVRGPNAPVIADGAQIIGEMTYEEAPFSEQRRSRSYTGPRVSDFGPPAWAFGTAMGIAAFVLGLLACLISPRAVSGIADHFRARPWASGLLGLVLAAFLPILLVAVFVFLAITVIGIPLGIILLFAFPFIMVLAYAFGAVVLGDLIFNRSGEGIGLGMRVLSLFLVLAVVGALGVVPVLGFLIGSIVFFIGLGAWTLALFNRNPRLVAAERNGGAAI
ncbi:MAG: bactofilin family protein [Glycocaulis sp.]|uniref:bactofilin family protein n=1 Tax=Glycocaulis sp. TaxID=1969725 RepID=UPI003F72DF00